MTDVAIVSAAYWGDVMPFVPLARELAGRGHDVSVVVPRGFHDAIGPVPFELVHLGTDFSPRELAEHGQVLDRATTPRGMRAAAELWVRQLCIEPAHEILAVLDGVAPAVWVVHPSLFWLVEMAAAPHGTPVVAGHLFPMMIPSGEQPPPGMPGLTAGLNRSAWRVGRRLIGRMMFDAEINQLRAERGLEPAVGNVGFGWQRAASTLLLTSPTYWTPPSDWPPSIVQTGFTVWDGGGSELPRGLEAFLDAGPPPVLVCFGTSAATDAADAFRQVAAAIERRGHRPLLLVGNERNRVALSSRADVWTFAPLPAVLPRCRAVVHAGGHGSTAAAMHAGVPQLALHVGPDQVGHARRVEALGVGVALSARRRTDDRLAQVLDAVLEPERAAAAAGLARRLAEEDGAGAAADHVASHLPGAPDRPV